MQGFRIIIILIVFISLSVTSYGGDRDLFAPWEFNNSGPEEKVEPQKRAHSPWLAAGLASESQNSKLPYGRRFPVPLKRDCGELQPSPSFPGHLLMQGVKIFNKYISRVDGDRCPMHPTCSAYSLQVIKKHGFFIGFMMTADRLIHESNEMDYAPLVKVGDRYKFYDPVSNNDFWWYDSKFLKSWLP